MHHRRIQFLTVVCLAGACLAELRAAAPEDVFYPTDSNVVNVRDFGARGDGRTDDTAAIQRALDATPAGNRIIYFPKGVYIVSDTLRWAEARHPDGSWNEGASWKNQIFEGENREQSIIRLAPAAKGFSNPDSPKAMIWTGPKPAQRFRNAVRNLTIDAGNHAGAIGLQFNTSNQGTVRDVTLRGAGPIGLDMAFTTEIGPLLVKNVLIEGFGIGIKTGASDVNSMTLEDVTLRNQTVVGLRNDLHCVTIHRLRAEGEVTAIHNGPGNGLISLVDARLQGRGPASSRPAVINEAHMYIRDLSTDGYARGVLSNGPNGGGVAGAQAREWYSHPPLFTTPAPARSLRLPIVDAPDVPRDSLDKWVSPQRFGAVINDGQCDADAIQKAIDSGQTTLYLPAGIYNLSKPVVVRGNIRRIIGTESTVEVIGELMSQPVGVFRVEDGPGTPLVFERIQGNPWNEALFRWFDHASTRDLIIRHCTFYVGHSYMNSVEGGRVFIEDVSNQTPGSGFWVFRNQTVYARQWNVENIGAKITNDGGTMWILGYKTERSGTLIETRNGRTELLGGLCYSLHYEKPEPMFLNIDSDVSITIGEAVYDWGTPFHTVIEERAGGQVSTLKMHDAYPRAMGSVIPFYRSANHPSSVEAAMAPELRPPQNLAARPLGSSEIVLSWTAAEEDIEYHVYRDGELVGVSLMGEFVDRGLAEQTSYTYEVRASTGGSHRSEPARVQGQTDADTEPPALVRCRGLRHPDRIELHFSKPIDPASAGQIQNYRLEGAGVREARPSGDGRTVELLLARPWGEQAIRATVQNIADTARTPNRMAKPAIITVAAPAPARQIFLRDFERDQPGSLPDGVMDNSDWNGGRVAMAVRPGPAGGRGMEMKVERFGQVLLARVPIEAGATYVVAADLSGGSPGQTVLLQVRQWDAPYTILGQGDFQATGGQDVANLSFSFKAPEGGDHVPVFFITHASGEFWIDNVRVAREVE